MPPGVDAWEPWMAFTSYGKGGLRRKFSNVTFTLALRLIVKMVETDRFRLCMRSVCNWAEVTPGQKGGISLAKHGRIVRAQITWLIGITAQLSFHHMVLLIARSAGRLTTNLPHNDLVTAHNKSAKFVLSSG